jgi:hypothetical protein
MPGSFVAGFAAWRAWRVAVKIRSTRTGDSPHSPPENPARDHGIQCSFEMSGRKYSDAMNREYGVQVAHSAGVCFAGARKAVKGSRGLSGTGHNRSGISNLAGTVVRTKMSKYLRMYAKGGNVKWFVPVDLWCR